jgi:hypothetical protein
MNPSSSIAAAQAIPAQTTRSTRPPPPKCPPPARPQPDAGTPSPGLASRTAQLAPDGQIERVRVAANTRQATVQRLSAAVTSGAQAFLASTAVGKNDQIFIGQDWALLRADLQAWLDAAVGDALRQTVTECVDAALLSEITGAARPLFMASTLGTSAASLVQGFNPVREVLAGIAGTLSGHPGLPQVARDHALRNIVLVCGIATAARALATQPGTPRLRRQALEQFAQVAEAIAAHDTRAAGSFGLNLLPTARAAQTLKGYLDGWCRGASQPAGAAPARGQATASLQDDEAPPFLLPVRRDSGTPVNDRKMTLTEADFTTPAGSNSSVERARARSDESVGADGIPTFHQRTPLVKPHGGMSLHRE